jgi:hypothetical protein
VCMCDTLCVCGTVYSSYCSHPSGCDDVFELKEAVDCDCENWDCEYLESESA